MTRCDALTLCWGADAPRAPNVFADVFDARCGEWDWEIVVSNHIGQVVKKFDLFLSDVGREGL